MKSDMHLRTDVLDELKWDPAVNAAQIRVEVKDGLVTLAGVWNTMRPSRAIQINKR